MFKKKVAGKESENFNLARARLKPDYEAFESVKVKEAGSEPEDFRHFLRMDAQSFDELLRAEPFIRKKDTVMRSSISPSERLSVTLRYLAPGNSFENLKFLAAPS
ncbi:hypothetical protein RRG08_008630 [Elysia crispata]|uniref:Uncharacterized protein n=1 Tax=Elysia crispata TaxID=231223 RepID=A0AAE0XYC6_9GAST|nr:hypothetical protein RRG08_008630 [Elysia crispata]